MTNLRLLPWEYGVRNLFRRPVRSLLTLTGLSIVVFLILLVVSFVQGLEASLAVSGDPGVVLIHSLGSSENIENSSIPGRTASLLGASLQGLQTWYGTKSVSPELYLGTKVHGESDAEASLGLVRGVTNTAPLVRPKFQLLTGTWPKTGEVLVGRLAATKLGWTPWQLDIGRTVDFEGRSWRVSGTFAALGSAFESELWCPVDDLQQTMKRQDLSLVALMLANPSALADVQEICKERVDLELEATPEVDYYASLQSHFRPIRTVAWLFVALVAGAGVFAGLNTMYGAVVGRVRELAMLQTIGFQRRVIALSLIQEAMLLAVTGSLVASLFALLLLQGVAVRFSMGAIVLKVDGIALLAGMFTGLAIGILGAIPPALKAMRQPIVEALKAI